MGRGFRGRDLAHSVRDVTFPLDHPAALLYASRQRWLSMTGALAVTLGTFGFCYLFGFFTVSADSRPYAVVQLLPGGMRTHGAVMLLLAVIVLAALRPAFRGRAEDEKRLRRVLTFGVGPYLGWTSLAFLAAPVPFAEGTWNLGWIWPAFGSFTSYLLAIKKYPTWSEVNEWLARSHRSGG